MTVSPRPLVAATRRSLLLAALPLALAFPLASQAQTRELKAGTSMAPDHPAAMMLTKFSEVLAQKSGGKLKMTVHNSGVLGADMQQQQQLQAGTQDVMTTGTATMAGQIKEMAILDFPYVFQSGEEFDRTMDGAMGKLLADKAYEKGWVVLGYTHNGFRNTTNSKRPITKWEDFDGLKLRVIQNAMYIDMFKQLGANPTPMPVTEVYTALETKAVDGQENPLAQIVTMRMQEVQKYLSLTQHSINSEALLMGRKSWDKLSKDEQAMVMSAAGEAKAFKRQQLATLEKQWLESVKKVGMQVNEVTLAERERMAARLKPVIDRQNERVGDEFARQFYAETAKQRVATK
ncbi:Extracytoplasmic solute receptor protein YiaO [Variovorax sp. PBL-H6]|uniref:DctP family TRAP transporter solute-binding subunit n=1 Tax=Variovorax sp. PBL-H6 TaxID=434009 RepID=UPI0013184425|nr:DctP family TRAP transporter solute-binding subunit [Variovorax sp. PBL-H6]VTU38323.1 Extracytoplasmic solute receptor protein YiaO [Variovorax sp. PBL-H6]